MADKDTLGDRMDDFGVELDPPADEAAAKRRKERQAAYLASLSQEEREALEKQITRPKDA